MLFRKRGLEQTFYIGWRKVGSRWVWYRLLPVSFESGTYYVDTCPEMPLFLYAAIISTAVTILQTFSMVVAFDGFAKKRRVSQLLPPCVHAFTSFLTFFNYLDGGCTVVAPLFL